eukprot:jgi/Chlat1/2545/Chrsp175S00146
MGSSMAAALPLPRMAMLTALTALSPARPGCKHNRNSGLRWGAGTDCALLRKHRVQSQRVAQQNITSASRQPHSDSGDNATQHHSPTYDSDTIASIVTPVSVSSLSPGSVAIVRLSGPDAQAIAQRVFRHGSGSIGWRMRSHRVVYGSVVDFETGEMVDEVLLLPMLAPRSYTREDVVELQGHGGPVCARRVLDVCLRAGARLARPGEFTMRAFLNGRLDLSQAESVQQLVSARTSQAAASALSAMKGGIAEAVSSLRTECIDLLAEFEARIDFDDELPDLDVPNLVERMRALTRRVDDMLATAKRGHLLQAGLEVALVGRPNVGKSSLLNKWSQSSRAIVTDIPGTTRDVVEAGVVVNGIPVRLLDTAGIRDTTDTVERIGVERSREAALRADVVVLVVSAEDGWTEDDGKIHRALFVNDVDNEDANMESSGKLAGAEPRNTPVSVLERDQQQPDPTSSSSSSHLRSAAPVVLAINKVDRASAAGVSVPNESSVAAVVPLSAATGDGIDALEAALLDIVGAGRTEEGGAAWAVNERQTEALVRARAALQRLRSSVEQDLPVDFWTIDLREAALALGQITGEDVTEDVLNVIFSRFCIGK